MSAFDIAVIVIISVAFVAAVGAVLYRRLIKKDGGCSCGCEHCKAACPKCSAKEKDKENET